MKRDLLPVRFVVKHPGDCEEWNLFMRTINSVTSYGYTGDSVGAYYGLNDYGAICDLDVPEDTVVITLEDFFNIIEFEKVTTYNGDEQIKELCVELHEYANHGGEWALKSDCTWCAFNLGFALQDDAIRVYGGNYVIDGTQSDYDIVFSDHEGDWLDTNRHNSRYGEVCNSRGGTSRDWFIETSETLELDGEWYADENAIRRCGYIHSERRDEWIHEENWESGFHDWDDDEDSNADNASYHDLTRKMKFDSSAKFTIGFEIEKEDEDMVSVSYSDLYYNTGWIKEKDGSLDDDTGYELVSPAFNLFDNKMDEDIANNKVLRDLINADKSSDCGGHINLGSTIYSTVQLFEGISGFFPLFYTMYEHRLNKSYSRAKKKHEYYNRDKYSSIFIKDNVVEIRIPSAVINVTNLIWRRDLMRIITENINKSEMQVLRMLLNSKSKLHMHLRKVYTLDNMIQKIEGFVKYSEEFNNVKLPKVNTNKLQKTNKLGA